MGRLSPSAAALARAAEILDPEGRKGRYKIADVCDVGYGAVTQWFRVRIPPEHCRAIEAAVDQKRSEMAAAGLEVPERVTRYNLRPDVFGEPPEGEMAAEQAVAG